MAPAEDGRSQGSDLQRHAAQTRAQAAQSTSQPQSNPQSPQAFSPMPISVTEDDEPRASSPRTGSNTFIFPIRSVYSNRTSASTNTTTSTTSSTHCAPPMSPPAARGPELGRSPNGNEGTDMSIPGALMDMLDSGSSGGRVRGSPPKSSATLSHRSPRPTSPSPSPPENELPVRNRTTLEPDDAGITNLVNDFSGIIRLGDAPNAGTTVEGSSTALPPVGPSNTATPFSQGRMPQRMGHASFGGLLRKGTQTNSAMRAQTRDSVRNFVNEQAHTVHVADPNAAAPSPGPDQAEVSSIGSGLPSSSESASGSSSSNLYTPQPISANRWVSFNDASSENVSEDQADETSFPFVHSDGVPAQESVTTFRFQHLPTDEGHHVVVGREGTLQRCEDEPITVPGAVQGFGVLILLEEDYDTGDMTVRQVSENSTELLGLSPQYLFRLQCFSNILTGDEEDILRDNIESLPYPDDELSDHAGEYAGPQVFRLSGYGEPGSDDTWDEETSGSMPSHRRREWTCWVAASRPKMDSWIKYDEHGEPYPVPDLVVLEFELERDNYNPLTQPFDNYADEEAPPESSESMLRRETGFASHHSPFTSSRHSSSGRTSYASGGPSGGPGSGEQTGSTPSLIPDGSNGSRETESTGGWNGAGESVATFETQPSMPSASELPSGSTFPTSAPTGSGESSSDSYRRRRYGLEGTEQDQSLERVLESTTNYAKPLRSLMGMRRVGVDPWSDPDATSGSGSGSGRSGRGSRGSRVSRGSGSRRRQNRRKGAPSSSDALDVVAVLNQINEQLGRAQDLDSFLKITVGLVKDLCRFNRVVVYQFDEEYNGKVVTELVDWSTTTDLWKGLMFPAADIPPQARELYRINKVRFLYDRSQVTARMVLRDESDLAHPLDMTHCFLRAMSPIHLKYLANMHVRSSMSISIMAFGKLWGLIACHSYGSHGMRVSFPVRQMLRVLSDVVSRNVERLRYAQRLKSRQLINTTGLAGLAGFNTAKSTARGSDTASDSHSSQGYIVSNADELLNIFDADSGLLVINDGCKLLGQCEQAHAMLAIAEYLRIAKFEDIVASNNITDDFPDLMLPRAADTIAGLLYVPLTNEAGQDFIVLLRKGQVDEVKWAGRPFINEDAENKAVLEPRSSFKLWIQKVTGRSRQWTDDQLDSARVLSLIYGKFIHVWRERQNAMMSNQLTAILLSNTSHAVRTPLSQIINTLELALAGNIDSDTRNMLENSHQASRALLFHVHDLLDLTRIETGNETAFNDPFDLRQTVINTVRLYQTETHRRGIGFVVTMSDDLPRMVIGDSRKVKTVVSNLVANAVKYTRDGSIEATCRLEPGAQHGPESASIEIIVSDTGCGISPEKLEAMFVTLEGAEDRAEGGGVGLGLAVVARIVEQLHGQLRAESEVGKGTKFYFTCSMGVNADFHPMGGSTGSLEPGTLGTTTAGPGAHDLKPSAAMATASLDHTKLKSRDGAVTPLEKQSSPTPAAAPAEPANKPVSPMRPKIGPKGGPQLRILVVEDDVINSQILQKRLKMDKHTVRAVENGQEAVDLIASDADFDAIIMDIQMPIMDGYGAAAAIREYEAKSPPQTGIDPVRVDGRIPIFALSASLYEDDRAHLGTHFDGWLLKPLQFNRLRALLAALMDGEKRAQEIYQPGQWERGGYFRDGKK